MSKKTKIQCIIVIIVFIIFLISFISICLFVVNNKSVDNAPIDSYEDLTHIDQETEPLSFSNETENCSTETEKELISNFNSESITEQQTDALELPESAAPMTLHTHKYAKESDVKPSCSTDGYIIYKCECGDSYKEIVSKTDKHDYQIFSQINASCNQKGKVVYKCSVCGKENIVYSEKTTEHSWYLYQTIQPTASEFGWNIYRCSVCDEEKKECIPKLISKLNINTKNYVYDYSYLEPKLAQLYEQIYQLLEKAECEDPNANIALPIKLYDDLSDFEVKKIRMAIAFNYNADCTQFRICLSKPEDSNVQHDVFIVGSHFSNEDFGPAGLLMVVLPDFMEMKDQSKEIDLKCKNILETFDSGDDLFIVNQIFDWAEQNITYDSEISFLEGLLQTKQGSCYAQACFVKKCCNMCGIKCDVIVGFTSKYEGYHAWNRIYINNKPTFWDVTSHIRDSIQSLYYPRAINFYSDKETLQSMPILTLN